ncbi:MAG: LuxR C-terminal-related transcriptional regulator [Sphingomonas sp.]|uniref:LuxR C-terminal-related transcriptional regulator n=1 Tax=Sphingomonas sp. TaxID=28214 RepID=UPI0035A81AED|nr:LuxR C-terminal-related transcriptional regulator [Sphingomonas sp.]
MHDIDNSHHGLSAREQEIMDLFAGGASEKDIATQLNVSRRYIHQTIGHYNFASVWSHGNRFNQMVVRGTKALAAACAASGGRFA